ncbi:hypothetical protein Drorol1_Dr00020334 [Drosera rotundifolia]
MMKSEGAVKCPAKNRSFLPSLDATEGPAWVKEPMKPEGTKIAPPSQNVPAKGIILALPSAVSKSHPVLKKEVGVISRSGVNNCPEKPSANLDGVQKRPIQRTETTKHMPPKEAFLEKFPKMKLKAIKDEKSKCREGPVVVHPDRSSIGAVKCPADERSCVSSKNATKVSKEASQTKENPKPEGMKRAPPRRNVPAKRAKVAVSSDGANSQPLRPDSDSDVSSVEDEPCSSSCVSFTRWGFASKGDALHVSMEKLQYASHQNTRHHEIMAKNVQGNDSNRKEFYEQEQRFQKQHKQDDARLEAEIKAALQQQRERWRKAQRLMPENMKKSVFFDDDYTSVRELESLIGDCSTLCTHSVRWHTPALKRSSSGRCTSPLSPLEQLGLFMKEEYDFDDDDDGMVLDGLEEGELLPQ